MKCLTVLSLLASGVSLAACGVSPTTTPTLTITTPMSNTTVNVSSSKLIAVNFTTNYTLKAPGACEGESACGSVYLLVDSTNCDQPGKLYNALAVSSPAEANLSLCAMAAGMHTITLELHNDSGAIVNDLVGNPVTTSVTVTAQTQ
jgi:hypothetical protein